MALRKAKPKKTLPEPEINITSLMDVLTTLIFFIVMMAAVHNFAAIPATPLQIGKSADVEQKPIFTLKIAVVSDKVAKFFLGATESLDVVNRGGFNKYMRARFSGTETTGFTRTVTANSKDQLVTRVQEILGKLKESFPNETRAVVAFGDKVTYQTTVDVISSVRSLASEAKAISVPGAIGTSESTRVLFPQIIISEWSEK